MSNNFFYIAQFFTPEPYLKDIDFIKRLKDKGWNPIVITSFPNYPRGEIYLGYQNRLFSEEVLDGIKIIRVYTYADHSLSSTRRALNYFIFGFFSALAILKYGKKNSFYYILQSSPFMVFCAWAIKLFKRNSKTLLDIQDVFPDNIRVSGFIKNNWLINIMDVILNNFYYKSFDFFITVSESFGKIISKKKISADRIMTLYNWSMVERSQNQVLEHFQFDTEGFNIVYAGNIGVHQGLSKLSEGINTITCKNPRIFFHFFGDGTDFELLSRNLGGNANVVLHGRVASTEISKYMDGADALFLHLIKDPIYESIIPSKLQAYIEIGKPILAGIEGEARSIVLKNKLGEVFSSEDIDQFENATLKIADISPEKISDIKTRSVNLYKSVFSREAGVQKIHEFILNHLK